MNTHLLGLSNKSQTTTGIQHFEATWDCDHNNTFLWLNICSLFLALQFLTLFLFLSSGLHVDVPLPLSLSLTFGSTFITFLSLLFLNISPIAESAMICMERNKQQLIIIQT